MTDHAAHVASRNPADLVIDALAPGAPATAAPTVSPALTT
ncbi:hypothetical protein NOGI109294_04275 [Nocardiopsis gilva]